MTPLDRRPRLPRALPEALGGLIGPVRRRWLNLGLGLVLAGCVAGAYLVVGDPGTSTASTARTTTVGRGDVTASVTGTGNLASARNTSLSFGASGTVTAVAVAAGDRVTQGQLLASIDDGSAERTLGAAEAELASAQAAYDELTAGQTATDQEKDELNVEAAELGVDSAQASLTKAKNQLASDIRAQDALVAKAKAALAAGTGTQAQLNAAVSTRRQVIAKDQQEVTSAQQQLLQAKSQLAQQRSTAEQNAAGATDAEVAQAQVSIENAEAGVAEAQDALDGTTLRAPFSGTVVSVAGSVGDAVSAGSSSSTGSSGSSASSGSSGSTSPSSTSTSSSSSTSASSAFVVLADLAKLQLTANVAEADIGSVKAGQAAQVTLTAAGTGVEGTVTRVSPEGTTSNNVVQYPVTVALSSAPEGARLGASAGVTITTAGASDVLTLQSSAITTLGSRNTVSVVRNGATTVVPIEIGLVGGGLTEVTSGLTEGETVSLPSTTSTSGSGGLPGFAPGLGGGGRP